MPERIGLLVGMENSFPPAFLERVNRESGVVAEYAKIGGTQAEGWKSPYRVLIDRISQEIPHYRFHLKAAALSGAYVINDPFWWSADDKFFGYSLAAKIGVAVPRTVMLPQKDYMHRIDKQRSLRNLEFPLDWEGIMRYVGFPAILKPADGGGWRDVYVVRSPEELMRAYDASHQLVMTLQEFIDFDEYIRCICIGREFILPIKYDPKNRCYVHAPGFLSPALGARVMEDAYKICDALGYDMNSVEFAVRDGVPYAIDFTNPAPDMAKESILEPHFDIVVEKMAQFAVKVAREGRTSLGEHYRFGRYLPPHERATAPGGETPRIAEATAPVVASATSSASATTSASAPAISAAPSRAGNGGAA